MRDDLDRDSEVPLYQQLADRLRERITRDGLTRLPSWRTLQQEYEVSRPTAERAIQILKDAGEVAVTNGKGTFVRRPAELSRAPPAARCVTGCHTLERGSILPRDTAGHPLPMRQIDRLSRVPPWQQIAAHLRSEIAAGAFSPDGPPLPSVNRLAQEWDVARQTALKALQALRDEGLIEPEDGMGYYVTR